VVKKRDYRLSDLGPRERGTKRMWDAKKPERLLGLFRVAPVLDLVNTGRRNDTTLNKIAL
jgi:hypothetical protein